MAPDCKPWYRSRTLRFNAAVAALTAMETSLHLLQPLMGEQTYLVLLFAATVGNAYLRAITSQRLTV